MKRSDIELQDKINQIENSTKVQESLIHFFNLNRASNIDRRIIFEALFIVYADKYNLEWLGDLWDIQLDYNDAKKLLSDFDFQNLKVKIKTNENIIPKEFLLQYKVKIKSKGLVWIINKYDADPFPSCPHAHQLENNIKLDLSNGRCYRKREYIYTLSEKDLIKIRNMVKNRIEIVLPPLEL